MLIQLQPDQIPDFWDAIKIAIVAANDISREDDIEYTNQVLSNILSGKFQCWLIFSYNPDNEKIAHAISVTSIVQNNLFGYLSLSINALYGLRKMDNQTAIDAINGLKIFAKTNSCKNITAETSNDRVKELAKLTGFLEIKTILNLKL